MAKLPRIPQIYSNGTRWYLDIIYVASYIEKLCATVYIIQNTVFGGIYDRTVKCNLNNKTIQKDGRSSFYTCILSYVMLYLPRWIGQSPDLFLV